MPKLRVSVCSYNGSLDASVDALNPPLSDWLLPGSDPVAGAAPPDLVAVGFQEMIPLVRVLPLFRSMTASLSKDLFPRDKSTALLSATRLPPLTTTIVVFSAASRPMRLQMLQRFAAVAPTLRQTPTRIRFSPRRA